MRESAVEFGYTPDFRLPQFDPNVRNLLGEVMSTERFALQASCNSSLHGDGGWNMGVSDIIVERAAHESLRSALDRKTCTLVADLTYLHDQSPTSQAGVRCSGPLIIEACSTNKSYELRGDSWLIYTGKYQRDLEARIEERKNHKLKR